MTWTPIDSSQVQATAPDDEELNTIGYKGNLDDLNARVIDLEASGGGGSVVTQVKNDISNWFSSIKSGGETNEGRLWRKRFKPNAQWLTESSGEVIDLLGDNTNITKSWWEDYQSTFAPSSYASSFKGQYWRLPKGKSISFLIKKGINYVGFSSYNWTDQTDNVGVLVDGVVPSSLGIMNENFGLAASTYNPNAMPGAAYNKKIFNLLGIDETKEHILKITNNDSASKPMDICFIEFGFLSLDYTITNKIKLNAGKTDSNILFPGGEFTFNEDTYSGHQGALVIDTEGVVTAIDGEVCATTAARVFQPIDFPNYPTSIKTWCISNFPSNGIASITIDTGDTFVFSYTGKDESSVINNALTGILWQSVFYKSMQSGLNPLLSTWPTNNDFIINYLGTAPIEITNSNNKVDFSITVDGITSSHTATIANGRYASDLMAFSTALNKAMQTAKSITGKYSASYDKENRIWTIGVFGKGITRIDFLFNSGANSANSIASTIGFSGDQTLKTSYLATVEKNHASCRPFEKGEIIDYTSPKFRFPRSGGVAYTNPTLAKIFSFTGYNQATPQAVSPGGNPGMIYFISDPNACGIELTFEGGKSSIPMQIIIDNRFIFNIDTCAALDSSGGFDTPIFTYFFTFPKGARLIKIFGTYPNNSDYRPSGTNIKFQFARELFCRPAIEKLNKNQKIIKTFEIAPRQYYENPTCLNNTASAFVAQGGIDKLKSFTESGTWAATPSYANVFTGSVRTTQTQNSYQEFEFTLDKDGSGFSLYVMRFYDSPGATVSVINIYLTSSGAINESTDLYATVSQAIYQGQSPLYSNLPMPFLGLKAGTYKVRFKKVDTSGTDRMIYSFMFSIIDSPLEKYVTNVSAISLTNKGLPIPVNYIEARPYQDNETLSSSSEYRLINSPDIYNQEYNQTTLAAYTLTYFNNAKVATTYPYAYNGETQLTTFTTDYSLAFSIESMAMGKDIFYSSVQYDNYSNSISSSLNGITLNTHDTVPMNKGGLSINNAMLSNWPVVTYPLKQSCSFSSGNTFLTSNTGYLKVNAPIILIDSLGNKEQLTITAVVTNVSFNVTSRSIVIDANVNEFHAAGYHNLKIWSNQAANNWQVSNVCVTPLPITYSKFIERFLSKELDVAYAEYKNLAAGTNQLSFPVFKDGSRGNANNTTAVVTDMQNASTFYSVSLGSDIIVTSSGGTISIKLTSIRK